MTNLQRPDIGRLFIPGRPSRLPNQDHRHIKSRTNVTLGFKRFRNAATTISGIELIHRIRKGQFDLSALALEDIAAPSVWDFFLLNRESIHIYKKHLGRATYLQQILCGYPAATIAFYGADDSSATKVSVGIVMHEGADADPLERFCATNDARTDRDITEAMVRFIDRHGIKSVVTPDRIIGCPHEEGTDYQEGENCSQCSFRASRDRWSGETIQ